MKTFLPLVSRKYCLKIFTDDIFYIQQRDKKLQIATADKIYEYYEKLNVAETYLDDRFYHCMKTLIVNFDKVIKMEDQEIIFENGESYWLGRDNYVRTKQKFSAYLRKLS